MYHITDLRIKCPTGAGFGSSITCFAGILLVVFVLDGMYWRVAINPEANVTQTYIVSMLHPEWQHACHPTVNANRRSLINRYRKSQKKHGETKRVSLKLVYAYASCVVTGPTNVDQRVSLEGLANRSSADVRGVQASVYKASRSRKT